MKNFAKFVAAVSLMSFIACTQEREKPVIITTPAAPAPAPVIIEKTTPPAPVEKKEDGTTIKIGKGGVTYEDKSGSNVKVSKDSSSVEIKTPR